MGRLCCSLKLSGYSPNHSSSTMSLVGARGKSRWSSCNLGGYERSTSTKYPTLALSGVSRTSWIVTSVLNANSERGSFQVASLLRINCSHQHRKRIDDLLCYCSLECIGYWQWSARFCRQRWRHRWLQSRSHLFVLALSITWHLQGGFLCHRVVCSVYYQTRKGRLCL